MNCGAPQSSLPVGGGEGVLLSLLLSVPYDYRSGHTTAGPEQCDLPLSIPFSELEAMNDLRNPTFLAGPLFIEL